MPTILRVPAPVLLCAWLVWTGLFSVALGWSGPVRADAPPPSQALERDPTPARASVGLSADGAAILLADYAARLDLSVAPSLSVAVNLGASERRGTEDLLVEGGLTVWFLGLGLEGPHLTGLVGAAWAGPWSQLSSLVLRAGGEAGWQFLWQGLSVTLAGGIHAAVDPVTGAVVPEPRARAALGITF